MAYLDTNGVPEPDLSARTFLCDVTKIGYRLSDFNRNQGLILSTPQIQVLSEYCKLRIERVPVQYVIGNWDFYGFTLLCKPPVLCPRPETEELVERILSTGQLQKLGRPPRILDIGSGTGAIGIALLSQLPTATCDAIDINAVAVSLSNENAQLVLTNPQRYNCRHESFLDFAASGTNHGQYDIIVSNPPYIPRNELAGLEPEVIKYEDVGALDGGDDGLDIVRDILLHSPLLLDRNSGGTHCGELWMEVARQHPPKIEGWFRDAVTERLTEAGSETAIGAEAGTDTFTEHFSFVEGIIDLAGNPRFVRLRLK